MKLTRLAPGHYSTEVRGEAYSIFQDKTGWHVQSLATGRLLGQAQRTKKAAVEELERFERSGRVTHRELKVPRRTKLEPGTELTLRAGSVKGVRGRVTFLRYVEVANGSAKSYVEILVRGKSRLIDPDLLEEAQIHRRKKTIY